MPPLDAVAPAPSLELNPFSANNLKNSEAMSALETRMTSPESTPPVRLRLEINRLEPRT